MTALILGVLSLAQAPDPGAVNDPWRYVLPPPGDPHEHPPLRALPLGREKPEDVVEKAAYRGRARRYGQIRYGSASSVRVTVVLDDIAPGKADLYIDADRNRRIEDADRVEGVDRTWRVPLKVAIVEGEQTRYLRRAAVFRLGATGLTLGYAAAGFLEGEVRLGDRPRRARRDDGDGNGRMTDAQDRLWIDLDDDGRWDAASEQFLYAAILPVGGARYAVRSDELGSRLSLAPLEGTGTVRILLKRPSGSARVVGLSATLLGRDGAAVGLSGAEAEATVPVGEYRVGTLTVALEDPAGGAPWNFVFAAEGARGEPTWHRVVKGGTVAIDPIGSLTLAAGVDGKSRAVAAGTEVLVRPRLYTGDGLSIVTSYLGQPTAPATADGPSAAIHLRGTGEQPLGATRSGFA